MKKQFKKSLALFLCLIMVLISAIPNLANSNEVGKQADTKIVDQLKDDLGEEKVEEIVNFGEEQEEIVEEANEDEVEEEIVEENEEDSEEELEEDDEEEAEEDEEADITYNENIEDEKIEEDIEKIDEPEIEEEVVEELEENSMEEIKEQEMCEVEDEPADEVEENEVTKNEATENQEELSENNENIEEVVEENLNEENVDEIVDNVKENIDINDIENIASDSEAFDLESLNEDIENNNSATPSNIEELIESLISSPSDIEVVEEVIASDSCADEMLFGSAPIYWYLTDTNTKLHIAGTQPVAPEYTDDSTHNSYSNSKMSSYKANITDIIFDDSVAPTTCSSWFSGFTSLTNITGISNLNTSNVTSMSSMFKDCELITDLNLSNFVTTSVTSMSSMFEGCTNLTTLDISNFTVPSTNRSNMIDECPSITTLKLSQSAADASSKWHIEYDWKKQGGTTIYKYVNGTNPTSTTNNKTTLPSEAGIYVRANSSDRVSITYNANGASSYYYSQTVNKGEKIKKPSAPSKTGYTFLNWFKESTYENVFSFDIVPTTSMTIYAKWFDNNTTDYVLKSSWYNNCTFDKSFVTKITFKKGGAVPSGTNFTWGGSNGLSAYLNGTEIVIYAPDSAKNIYLLSTSNSSNNLFSGFSKLKEIVNLDVLDVSNCTTFYYMFYGCYALQNIDLSNFNTTNAVNMQYMFGWCLSLNDINLSTFDTRNVSNMQSMFNNCSSLEILDVGNFNTTNVVDMSSMFASCKMLRSLDLSNFNTMNVTNMSNMFNNCQALTSIDVSSFNTLNVTNISHMFSQCRKLLKLDIRSFNTSNVTDMRNAFSNSRLLHTIYATNNFKTDKANKKSSGMFTGVVSIIGSAGTTYDKSKKDCTYARIDNASVPGYFSSYNSNTAVLNLDKGINNYNVTSIKVSRKAKGTTVTVPANPFTRGEYIFKGWVDQNGNPVAVGSTIILNDDVTLTAKWKTNDLYLRNNWLDESIIKRTKVTKITFQNGGSASGTMFNVGENETIKGYVDGTEVTIIIPSGKILYLGDGSVFYNFTSLEEIESFNLLNTSKTKDMSLLFYLCTYLESVDLSNFDTSEVIDMQSMFGKCLSLTILDVSSFDTSNVHYEGACP